MSDSRETYVRSLFEDSISVKQGVIRECLPTLIGIADAIIASLKNGGKLMLCGNGGSAADAQHLAAELLVRLRPAVNRAAIPALALAADMSSLTACGNDYSYEVYYQRMVEAVGKKGDVLLGITTSGKSGNVIKAFEAARAREIVTVGFLGAGGGPALESCDHAFIVPSDLTGRIQESHITAGHAVMELVENGLGYA